MLADILILILIPIVWWVNQWAETVGQGKSTAARTRNLAYALAWFTVVCMVLGVFSANVRSLTIALVVIAELAAIVAKGTGINYWTWPRVQSGQRFFTADGQVFASVVVRWILTAVTLILLFAKG